MPTQAATGTLIDILTDGTTYGDTLLSGLIDGGVYFTSDVDTGQPSYENVSPIVTGAIGSDGEVLKREAKRG